MATPHAVGVAALILDAAPWLIRNVDGLEALMKASAVPRSLLTSTCSSSGKPAFSFVLSERHSVVWCRRSKQLVWIRRCGRSCCRAESAGRAAASCNHCCFSVSDGLWLFANAFSDGNHTVSDFSAWFRPRKLCFSSWSLVFGFFCWVCNSGFNAVDPRRLRFMLQHKQWGVKGLDKVIIVFQFSFFVADIGPSRQRQA